MKLMTTKLEKQFEKYPLYSQEKKMFDAKVIVKYFCPYNGAYWFITEGEKQDDGDWLFFGYGYQGYWEWGYVTLKYLENYKAKAFGIEIPNAVERDRWLDKNATVRSCLKDIGVNINESLIKEKEDSVLYYSEKIPKDADLENDKREIEYFLSYEDGDCSAAGYSNYKEVENMAINYLADHMEDDVVYIIKDVFHRTKRGTRYHTEQDYNDCKTVSEATWGREDIEVHFFKECLNSGSDLKNAQKLTEAFKLNDDNILVPLTSKEEDELDKSFEDDEGWSKLTTNYKGHCPCAYFDYDNEDGQNKGLYFYNVRKFSDGTISDGSVRKNDHLEYWHEFDEIHCWFEDELETRISDETTKASDDHQLVQLSAYCVPETEESFKAHSGDPIVDKTKKPFLIYEYTWDDKEGVWKLTAYEGDGTHPKFDPKLKGDRYELDWEEATEIEEDLDEKIEIHDILNPILFDDNKEIISEVKDKLEKIVENYVSEVKNRGDNKIDVPIKDIVLVGSNVSYNYSSKSDIDLHIVIDTNQLEEDKIDFYSIIYNDCRSIYNNKHDLKIKGTPVEISIEMGEVSVESNGIYSLNTGWIKEPTKNDTPEINEEAYEKEFKKWEERYLDIIKPYFKMAEEEITEPSTEETIEENLKEVWYDTPNYRNYNKEQPYKDQITYFAVHKEGRTEEVNYITASPGLIKQIENYVGINRIYAFYTSDVNKYKRLISKAGFSDREASDKLLKDLKKAGVPYGVGNVKTGRTGAYLEAELKLEYPENKNKEKEVEK